MRRLALAVLLLAGCSEPEPVYKDAVDINAAADRARGDIETYAANILPDAQATADAVTATPDPTPADASPPLTPAAPGQPGGLPDDRTPIAEGSPAPDSPQAAAAVVQRYYAAIESGKYRQAWALWDHDGADSRMTAAAFAESFRKYREYHVNIGAPGDVDAGAGQRYVTVPVQVYARLADGRPDYRLGRVTLHRVGNIDGATAGQKQWHIRSIDLKPAAGGKTANAPSRGNNGNSTGPAPASGPPGKVTARYRCKDGSRITVRFDNRADTAVVMDGDRQVATLRGQKAASGIWYRNARYELRGKGDAATFTAVGKPPLACMATR